MCGDTNSSVPWFAADTTESLTCSNSYAWSDGAQGAKSVKCLLDAGGMNFVNGDPITSLPIVAFCACMQFSLLCRIKIQK